MQLYLGYSERVHPDQLRARRRGLGLTQAQLAERLGISANTIARWERGEKVPATPRMLHYALTALEHAHGALPAPPRVPAVHQA